MSGRATMGARDLLMDRGDQRGGGFLQLLRSRLPFSLVDDVGSDPQRCGDRVQAGERYPLATNLDAVGLPAVSHFHAPGIVIKRAVAAD